MVALSLIVSLSILIPKAKADAPIYPKPQTPTELIIKYAEQYNTSSKVLLSVAKCESGLNQNAINYNDGGKGKHSVGIFQFQKSTFDRWSNDETNPRALGEELDYYSVNDQAKLASYMFSKGQGNQWTCYRNLY